MEEPRTMNQVKERLTQFLEDIEQVNPDDVDIKDVDEWIALLDKLETKVNQLRQ
ncbi:SE1561 family protein [Staphylococcus chromogenes]|uniref:SE1561 family protein n=1 Tax=Staphylococcus chromogenes TaxID=46126 RepID=UPI0018E5A299|nr:SE1561 family protein [Staphylococcus chromogenes]